MRVTLIHNPEAGDGGQPGAEDLKRLVRAAGHEVSYVSSEAAGWEAVLERPADLIAVAGGDGTVGGVAKRLAGRGVPLTALPMGTANNIARTLGLSDIPTERLIAGWADARRERLDLGAAKGPWGTSRFIEGAGIGLFAWTMPHADKSRALAELDEADAKIVYALQMLKNRLERSPAIRLEATLDGKDVSGTYVMFEAMNMRYVGPNLYLAPDSDPGDGCLDIVFVTEPERRKFCEYLSSWQKGKMREPNLRRRRGKRLQLHWNGFEVHFDDDVWPQKKDAPAREGGNIEIRLGGEAVEFLCPAGARR